MCERTFWTASFTNDNSVRTFCSVTGIGGWVGVSHVTDVHSVTMHRLPQFRCSDRKERASMLGNGGTKAAAQLKENKQHSRRACLLSSRLNHWNVISPVLAIRLVRKRQDQALRSMKMPSHLPSVHLWLPRVAFVAGYLISRYETPSGGFISNSTWLPKCSKISTNVSIRLSLELWHQSLVMVPQYWRYTSMIGSILASVHPATSVHSEKLTLDRSKNVEGHTWNACNRR